MHIPVFANGDINTPERAKYVRDILGLDGAMIGRASIGNPWFFNEVKHYFETDTHKPPASIKERAEVARRHLEMSVSWKGERLGVYETRRHYSNYFKGIENFKPFRQKLVTTETSKEVYTILDSIAEKFAEYSF
jgi:tRNA-dihydrouridine synthase